MPLESLLDLVETLKERIDEHSAALRGSEALTRYALIDPLLRELGWDTSNPDMVVPEYRVPNNQLADYVLFNEGSPVMVVESKKLDEPLQGGKALDQGILYCAHTGSNHFLLTDGRRWEIYESSSTVPTISFDLLNMTTSEICLKALALWRPSVQSGYVAAGQTPVVDLIPDRPTAAATQTTYIATGQTPIASLASDQPVATPPQPMTTPQDEHGWQPLTEVSPSKGQRPVEILFPDNRRTQMKYWRDVPVEVVRWLIDKRMLSAINCPIIGKNPKALRYMVHTRPFHSKGNPFIGPVEVNGLYIEINDNQHALINKTKFIIGNVGHDPAQFKVRFS